ncbi:MAG TPA: type II toxin-antitoxin system PemK/MazF family toxin [Gemmataceae bacterium]|jgi:mRNA interferase MazF|nr:type II toxin-antitoxin system PemK/MazF family toxin [Gemmataceae bacterium]
MKRGDVVLAFYPFAAGAGGSRRPALIVQSDFYNQRIANSVIAQITTNLRNAGDHAHLLVQVATPEGQQSGLLHDSLISCINLATVDHSRIHKVIGALSDPMMKNIDECLKAALDIP